MRKILYLLAVFSIPAFATQTYECKFTNYSDQKGNSTENLNLTFIIDKASGKSYMVGNNGSGPVEHIDRGLGVSFVEITLLGNVMSTTIDTKMNSVHSRNTVAFSGELIPSQYYGSCVKK